MRTYFYANKLNGDYIFDNFPNELKYLIADFKQSREPILIKLEGVEMKARMALKKDSYGLIYVLTTETKFITRYKFFKELVEISTIGLKPLINFQTDLIESNNSNNEEFIHNVISLNSYSIQALFSLIPQATLTENINKQTDIIKSIIAEKPNVTASTLLNLIKYNLATKIEFSVFERTSKPCAFLNKEDHSIRSVILSILQIFIADFDKKNIEVYLEACERFLRIDYDSLLVSLYYIFDNAVKYCCPRTDFKIRFHEDGDNFEIIIIMISVKIEKNELQKLSVRGFRSERALKLNKEGHGIGMYRIMKTLKLNKAELKITPTVNDYKRVYKDIDFEANEFKITFKDQKNWFKKN